MTTQLFMSWIQCHYLNYVSNEFNKYLNPTTAFLHAILNMSQIVTVTEIGDILFFSYFHTYTNLHLQHKHSYLSIYIKNVLIGRK